MNLRSLIPPLTALVMGGVWLGVQGSSIRELKRETVVLREKIAMARRGWGAGSDQSLATRMKEQKGETDREIDWMSLGSKMAKGENGQLSDMRTMMELQTSLTALSGEQLLAELDKIDGLDLSREVRKALDGILVGMLAQKDPKAALDRWLDQVNDQGNGMSWQLSNAFQQWQKKDPATALAWFDAEISRGSFESKKLDGRSDARLRFAAVAIRRLLTSAPGDAQLRIEALPEDQRKQVFNAGLFSGLKEESHKAFADLVRAVVPEEERGEAFNAAVSAMARKDFDQVDGFISNIQATTSEKEAIVAHAAQSRIQGLGWDGEVDRAGVDEVRAWAATQSPDKADAITGKSLANIWGGESSFDDRVKMIETLHAEGAGDDLIISFLSENHQAQQSSEISRTLAERIRDESQRAKLLEEIGGGATVPIIQE